MKFALIFVALFGACFAAPRLNPGHGTRGNLRPALDELLGNVDLVNLAQILPGLLASPDGQAALEYLRGSEFGAVLGCLNGEPEVAKLLDYLASNGLPEVYDVLEAIREFLGIPPRSSGRQIGTLAFADLVEQLLGTVNVDGLVSDLLLLISGDAATQDLLAYLGLASTATGYRNVKNCQGVQALLQVLRSEGLDVDAALSFIESLLGWNKRMNVIPNADDLRPAWEQISRNFNVTGFIDLLPEMEVDEDGKAILEFLRGPEFVAAEDCLIAEPELVGVLDYMEENGLNGTYEAIAAFKELLQIPPRPLPRSRYETYENGTGFLDKLLELVDTEQLLTDLLELLGVDPAFQNLFYYLGRPETAAGYFSARECQAIVDLITMLEEKGYDVQSVLTFVESLLGWEKPTKAVVSPKADDLRPSWEQISSNFNVSGFIALLPEMEVDEDGKAILEFLRGPEFVAVEDCLIAEPELVGVLDYMEENGLNGTYEAIAAFKELLQIPPRPLPRSPFETYENGTGFLDKLLELVDTEQLLTDLLELLGVDPAFQNLFYYIGRPETAAGYFSARECQAVVDLITMLEEKGYDVQSVLTFVESLLGWEKPTKLGV